MYRKVRHVTTVPNQMKKCTARCEKYIFNVQISRTSLLRFVTCNYLSCRFRLVLLSQILHYDEWLLTSTSMRSELDELDEYHKRNTCDPETNEALDSDDTGEPESTTFHAHLGSRQGNHSFSDIMLSYGTDRAFTNFRMKLNGFLNGFLPQHNIPLPDGRRIHLRAEDMVCSFTSHSIHYTNTLLLDNRVSFLACQLRINSRLAPAPRFTSVQPEVLWIAKV